MTTEVILEHADRTLRRLCDIAEILGITRYDLTAMPSDPQMPLDTKENPVPDNDAPFILRLQFKANLIDWQLAKIESDIKALRQFVNHTGPTSPTPNTYYGGEGPANRIIR